MLTPRRTNNVDSNCQEEQVSVKRTVEGTDKTEPETMGSKLCRPTENGGKTVFAKLAVLKFES